jgi:hypothetical protein
VRRCLADNVERVQLKAQFSQTHVAGIHRVTHNSPQDADPVGQLATYVTKAKKNRIWPVRRPLEAAAVASRVRWGIEVDEAEFSCHMPADGSEHY